MFKKNTTNEGFVYLTSSVLPAMHAFSTRLGGVSKNGFETVIFWVNEANFGDLDFPASFGTKSNWLTVS